MASFSRMYPRTVLFPALGVLLGIALGCDPGGGDDPTSGGPGTTGSTDPSGASSTSSASAEETTDPGTSGDGSSGDESTGGIEPPPGYNVGRELYEGSEAMLVHEDAGYGLTLDYGVMSSDISGDGSTVWVALYNEYAPSGPDYKVYSMNVDGTDVQESSLVRPDDAPYAPQLFRVRTTDDGETAILTQYTYDSLGNVVAQFERASRGGAFSVLTTSNGEVEGLGLADSVLTEVTAEGDAIVFRTGRNLWRADEAGGWVPFVIGQVEALTWNGADLPGNSVFRGLDITDNGGEFASMVDLTSSDSAVIVGTSVATTAIEAVEEGGIASFYDSAEIDGAGEVVTYSHPNPVQTWVGEQGGVHEEIAAPVGTINNADLADDGQMFHAVVASPTQAPFWQDVGGNERTASMSSAYIFFGSVPTIYGRLSHDGSVFLTPTWGLIAVQRGVTAYGAGVDYVFWRFDDEGDLVVRAVVTASDEIKYVTVHPLLERYLRPSQLWAFEQDPTYLARNGVTLEPLEGEPNTYEGIIDVNPDATEPLDERFSFRVTVQQGPAGDDAVTSTGFKDFDLFL